MIRNPKLSKGQDVHLDTVIWKFCIKCQKDKPIKGSKMIGPNMYICADCRVSKETSNQSNSI